MRTEHKPHRLTSFIFSVFLLFLGFNFAFSSDKAAQIENLMDTYFQYGKFNGSYLVAEKGKIIVEKGLGYANMEWEIPNAPDTKFRLASITKQFTAMAIMQLAEQGKIELDGKISDYLPYYRKDTGQKVTIHQLLSHSSGIPNYTNIPGFMRENARDYISPKDLILSYCSGDLEFEPGTKFNYSNSGYIILGAIIEEVTGKSYEDVLQQNIFLSLGMKNSGYDHNNKIIKKRAAGYNRTFDGYENSPYIDMSVPYAAGSLYSTVEDMYLWDQALYTDKLLSDKYRKIMFTSNLDHYAYGWSVRNLPVGETGDSVLVTTHNGGIFGFSTRIVRLVKDHDLIVLFSNCAGTDLQEMSQNIINILYNQPYSAPRKSIAQKMNKLIRDKGVDEAVTEYHHLRKDSADDYDFGESELNLLGYNLMGNGQLEEAVAIFKLNVETFPESSNVYDSLGEAYMNEGEKDLAIKNYAKSLEMDPGNSNAIIMLKRIMDGAQD